ncbi:hypothetical protein DFH29DRAFT_941402 [Suillus ampliporus]|nr:hypothetical protein DFH29DRAFT_941402 [Suillus ampliporus]
MAYTINTGCVTSIFSIATVIACAAMLRNFIFLGIEFLVTKLYVNSYLALLNARYYFEASADTINSSEYHVHHRVYRPELHVGMSRDRELQASQKNMFNHLGDEVVHPTRSDKKSTEVTVEMDSFSSV